MRCGLKVGVITLAISASMTLSALADTVVTAICDRQYMTHDAITNEVRVWSDMVDLDSGDVYGFWQYVAYNDYKVGVTYDITFDDNGNFVSIIETTY